MNSGRMICRRFKSATPSSSICRSCRCVCSHRPKGNPKPCLVLVMITSGRNPRKTDLLEKIAQPGPLEFEPRGEVCRERDHRVVKHRKAHIHTGQFARGRHLGRIVVGERVLHKEACDRRTVGPAAEKGAHRSVCRRPAPFRRCARGHGPARARVRCHGSARVRRTRRRKNARSPRPRPAARRPERRRHRRRRPPPHRIRRKRGAARLRQTG